MRNNVEASGVKFHRLREIFWGPPSLAGLLRGLFFAKRLFRLFRLFQCYSGSTLKQCRLGFEENAYGEPLVDVELLFRGWGGRLYESFLLLLGRKLSSQRIYLSVFKFYISRIGHCRPI